MLLKSLWMIRYGKYVTNLAWGAGIAGIAGIARDSSIAGIAGIGARFSDQTADLARHQQVFFTFLFSQRRADR